MKKKPRATSERAARRAGERATTSLLEQRERLFVLEPGGNPRRPIDVSSASVVETQALALPCPRCAGAHELVEHAAVTIAGERLREARLRCRQCGSRRSLFFRLTEARPN